MFNKRLSQLLLTNYEIQYLRLSSINRSRHYQSSQNKVTSSCKFNYHQQYNIISKINKDKQLCSSNIAIRNYSNLSQKKVNIEEDNDTTGTHDSDNFDDLLDKNLTENGTLYSILQNSDKYSATITPLLFDELKNELYSPNLSELKNIPEENSINTLAPSELIELLKSISYQAKINGEYVIDKYHRLLNLLDHYVDSLTNNELWLLLRVLSMSCLPISELKNKHPALLKLEDHLNKECQNRMRKDWTISETLMTCDLFYHMRLPRGPFVSGALKKLGTKPQKLTPENFVHYMFLLNVGRKPTINMYELEYHLESVINKYNVEELGIIGIAFFKTNTKIRNPALLNHMLELCIKNIDTIDNFILCGFMKLTRQSLQFKEVAIFKKLLQAFKPRINTTSTACIVHTAHAAATTLINEKDVLDLIMNRFIEKVPSSRLKDLERILFSMMIFKYPSNHPLYSIIIDELKNPNRKDELLKYPKTFSTLIQYLTFVGIYPIEIISEIMNPDYIKKVYNDNSFFIGREYLSIESGLKIEVPDYKGPFLPPRLIDNLGKRNSVWNIDVSNDTNEFIQGSQKYVTEIIHYIKQVISHDKIKTDQILPHHQRTDIICCIDKNTNEFISIDKIYKKLPDGTIKYPIKNENYKWIAIILSTYNQTYRDSSDICGNLDSKVRQVKKLGYVTTILSHTEWKLQRSNLDKKQFINDFILNCKNL